MTAARPADCLVQIEGRTLINGTCDFTLGSRVARVMVDQARAKAAPSAPMAQRVDHQAEGR